MKKAFFYILSVISIITFILSGIIYLMYFTEENAGMIVLFLLPCLLIGLISGGIAIVLYHYKEKLLGSFTKLIYLLNIILMILGTVGFVYAINN